MGISFRNRCGSVAARSVIRNGLAVCCLLRIFQRLFYCVLDAAGAVRCAGYEIHIGFLSVYDAVRYDFGTVEECLVIFVFQNQYRFDRLILQATATLMSPWKPAAVP